MAYQDETELIQEKHNVARFFTTNRHISCVLLLAVFLAGFYGYANIPKLKDPVIPVRVATAVIPWPGVSAEKVEQLVTRPVEETIATNLSIHQPAADSYGIKSFTIPGLAVIQIQLGDGVDDTEKEFNDINLKLNAQNASLPQGAGPIQFNSGFGETAALMLTVASPKESPVELAIRARDLNQALARVRRALPAGAGGKRLAVVVPLARAVDPTIPLRLRNLLAKGLAAAGLGTGIKLLDGPGFVGLDMTTAASEAAVLAFVDRFAQERLGLSGLHPDAWPTITIGDPRETLARLTRVAGDKYSYAELDDLTDLIQRTVQGVPQVSKVDRSGVLPQQVYLAYSQEKLAAYGVQPDKIKSILNARNITLPGGVLQIADTNIYIDPSGQFTSAGQIGDVIITATSSGIPVYLRDLVDIYDSYQSPPRFLNYFSSRDAAGNWIRGKAITLSVMMHDKEQINQFGTAIDAALRELRQRLPADLIIAKTSNQPRQVKENIDLFMTALYEAILLVVVVALLGFWEWRSALLMAISIPITLALTFAMIYMLGLDLQQVSIATLIIALGLLVDDPIVAGDAIKRDLAVGHPPSLAAWLGPTKLAKAILFATITNIVAYLPFLLLSGNTGKFLYSLPIVMACALIASRLVSMTFLPLLGYYLLRPSKKPERSLEERTKTGFSGHYYRVGNFAIRHRWLVFVGSLAFLVFGAWEARQLKVAFFPDDIQYLFYIDVWLPNNAPLSATDDTSRRVAAIVQEEVAKFAQARAGQDGRAPRVLEHVTTFVGGSGPRFWFSLTPQLNQLNYAQLIVEVQKKEDTPLLVAPLQKRLSAEIAGARISVRQLQTNPVEKPIAIRISGRSEISAAKSREEIRTLRALAQQVTQILAAAPEASRIHDDWGAPNFKVQLLVDSDRANQAGVTNQDVAASSTAAMNGIQVTTLLKGDKQIPVLVRLLPEERSQLSSIENLYIYSSEGTQKVPLLNISKIAYSMETGKINRLEHFRTVTVEGYPVPGALSSEVLEAALPQLREFEKTLPPGYKMVIGGEKAKQVIGFHNLAIVLLISVSLIFVALVIQFNNAVKPFLVFAAVPYGAVGALIALDIMNEPFGFMAFLGIASLVGVIVSHVIVLFDFIEQKSEEGEPLRESLLEAGIIRLRPVMITVGATVLALIPLAMHGGPLWQPLCYAQIGGLALATFIELLLVPVLYAIFVLDLKIIKWEGRQEDL
ncbi:MAG: efflux RND transporter permease subunit [Deltaproteobacteria bacterium]|nr:efflux RND transporter permease subunit [Deltaproteobacteria bacterium]